MFISPEKVRLVTNKIRMHFFRAEIQKYGASTHPKVTIADTNKVLSNNTPQRKQKSNRKKCIGQTTNVSGGVIEPCPSHKSTFFGP